MHPWEIDPEQLRVNGLSYRSNSVIILILTGPEIKFRKAFKGFSIFNYQQILIRNS